MTARGLAGDRAWTVVEDDGVVVRAKDAPGLAEVSATGDPDADAQAVGAFLGRAVRLVPPPEDGTGVAPLHVVSRGAIERAAAGRGSRGMLGRGPAREPASSALDGDERTWVGRHLRVGEAVLEVTRTPKHCLGIYAEVRTPGRSPSGTPSCL